MILFHRLYRLVKNCALRPVPAFSLVELSMVLVIMGVLIGAIFKGQELLDTAKIQSIVSDVQQIKMAINAYHDTYNAFPGDDAKASQRFGQDAVSGNGDGVIDETESANVWMHLYKAGDMASSSAPTSKLGGSYQVLSNPTEAMSGVWISLSNHGNGVLTPKQAQKIMTRIDDKGSSDQALQGHVQAANGANGAAPCLVDGKLNLSHTQPACVLYVRVF